MQAPSSRCSARLKLRGAASTGRLWLLWSNTKQPDTWESWAASVGLNNEHKFSFKVIITPLVHCMWAMGWEVEEAKDFLTIFHLTKRI